jgi:serine/threonine protein kinase/tetratricopeptide (TPR) repeat protein
MRCPEAEVLARFVHGKLAADAVILVEAHVDSCEGCFAAVAAAAVTPSTLLGRTEAPRSYEADVPAALRAFLAHGAGDAGEEALAEGAFAAPDLPESIGPYRVLGVLGKGGMGVVYRAEHVSSERRVALKTVRVPRPSAFACIRHEVAFLKEARIPGVVEIVDYDLSGREPWYAMELLEGETLAHRNRELWAPYGSRIEPRRALRPPRRRVPAAAGRLVETLTLFGRLCAPLTFVHRAGIVHCDLKPANVFLRFQGHPVLMDFGLVSRAGGAIGRESLQVAGRLRGTAPYISPEVIRGQIPDARADLYALGCMLYESLTGQPPFCAPTAEQVIDLHLSETPVRASERVSDLPRELDDLLSGLLEKRPQARIGHAEDVASVLAALGAKIDCPRSSGTPTVRPTYLFRPQLVHRDRALAQVLACCERAHCGRGSLVFVEGESGIGKTFFASELSQRALMRELSVITGECVHLLANDAPPADRLGPPLHPFRNFLQAVGDRCRERGPKETLRLLGSKAKLLAPYEPTLAYVPEAQPSPEPAALPAPAARERLVQALLDVLSGLAAAHPLLITLDDLQWADDLSLALLDALTHEFLEKTPLVIVGTYRSDEAGETLRRIAAKPWALRVGLDRLDESGVGAMVADMLAMTPPPDDLIQLLHARCEGIPFFVAEYLRATTAEGLLVREGGRWQVGSGDRDYHAALAAVSFPTSLIGLVRRRLDGLTHPTRTALEAAAILGREFALSVLALTLGVPEMDAGRALREAVARRIVEDLRDGRYRFLHDKIRETAHAGLSAERRRQLHGAAARAILVHHAGTAALEERFGELAYHFRAANDPERAVAYLVKAGERALLFSASADAARYFKDALDLERTLPERVPAVRRAGWYRQVGDALQGLGRMAESVEPLGTATALLGWPLPRSKAKLGLRLVPVVLRQTVHRLWPSRLGKHKARASDGLLEAGRAFDRLQEAFFYTGQDVEFLFANMSILNLLELAEATPELAVAYANTGAVCMLLPARGLAQRYFQMAAATLERASDPAARSYLLMLLAIHDMTQGRGRSAAEHADRAIAVADDAGFLRRRDECLAVRAAVEIVAGRHVAARPWLLTLESSASRRGDVHMLSWALLQNTQCMILRGALGEARAAVARVDHMLDSLPRPDRAWGRAAGAYVAYRLGDLPRAEQCAREATALVSQGPPVHSYCIDSYARLAELGVAWWADHRASADEEPYARRARAACAVLEKAARLYPVARPSALLHRGKLCCLSGERAKALRLWRKGLGIAQKLDLRYDEARLSRVITDSLAPGALRVELGQSAERLLAELEIEPDHIEAPRPGDAPGRPTDRAAQAGSHARPSAC